MSRGTGARALLVLAVALLGAVPGAVSAQTNLEGANDRSIEALLEDYEAAATALENRFLTFQGELKSGPLTRSKSLVELRYDEAVYAYLVENYDRCALLMFSLLDNYELTEPALVAEAEWYLADSLYQVRNYFPAQTFFRDIVDGDPGHPFYEDAVAKLLEIFGLTGDEAEFNIYYERFLGTAVAGTGSPRVRYALGKTLFRRGEVDKALEVLRGFPENSGLTRMARYLFATATVHKGRAQQEQGLFDAAEALYLESVGVYRSVLQLEMSMPEHEEVQALTWLAIGRLYLEMAQMRSSRQEAVIKQAQSDNTDPDEALLQQLADEREKLIAEAVASYQPIDWSSPHFADALYETTWAYITEGDFDEALRTIDIFELAFAEDVRKPELDLLRAHLQAKKEKWDVAVVDYMTVSDRYSSIRDRMDGILAKRADPIIFFNQLVDEATALIDEELVVPPLALRIARQDKRVFTSVAIAKDLQDQRAHVDNARKTVQELERALHDDAAKSLLQTYRIGHQQIENMRGGAVGMLSELATLEASYILNTSSGGAGDLAGQRDAMSQALGSSARTEQEEATLVDDLVYQAAALGERSHTLQVEVENFLQRLSASETFLSNARARELHSPENESVLAREIADLRRELETFGEQLDDVRDRTSSSRIRRKLEGLEEGSGGNEDATRDAAADLAALAQSKRSQSRSPNAARVFSRLDGLRQRLAAVESGGPELHAELERLEGTEVDEIREMINIEKEDLGYFDADAFQYQQDARALNGAIAEASFLNVQQQFADLVLRADMGITDVYWILRNRIKTEKRQIAQDRADALQDLGQRFDVVLEGFEDVEAVIAQEEAEAEAARKAASGGDAGEGEGEE